MAPVYGRWEASLQPKNQTLPDIAEEDTLRAQCYALLARLLAAPPSVETLSSVGEIKGDASPLGQAMSALAAAARKSTPEAISREYHDLFIGLGKGEMLPYGSYYLTGFLHEKPLADLRGDMATLGIARSPGVSEPEDHIAAVCEMMCGLITGAFGRQVPVAEQRRFFDLHLGRWAPQFFKDLQATKSAAFYMPVGLIGQLFMDVESEAFAMAA
ncbi:MAG: molecular chaperone TorD family protein [Rhodospirillales bacterium]|nr:molecular chaperone TorD family protein [Rhodospirillales bacterium]